jgi:hypothetical protein
MLIGRRLLALRLSFAWHTASLPGDRHPATAIPARPPSLEERDEDSDHEHAGDL